MFFSSVAEFLQGDGATLTHVIFVVWRVLAPVLGAVFLWRCAKPLLTFRREPEIWAWLVMPDGKQLPVTHWENIIGRSSGCDIVVKLQTVSRKHAVLTRYEDGSWSLTDIGSRGTVQVNGETVSVAAIHYGDVFSLGGVNMFLAPVTTEEIEEQKQMRTKPSQMVRPSLTTLILTVFQLITMVLFWGNCDARDAAWIAVGFLGLIAMEWILYLILKCFKRRSFEVENIAFFLSTIGMSVIASDGVSGITKQLICIAAGIVIYLVLGWSLRDLNVAKKFRYVAAAVGILLLAVNLVLGQSINGARNWISIGSFSFQPSELVKLCFIYVGASTMDRVVTKRNLILFIGYSAGICGCLALMNDFGTALIFFVTFLVIAFMRSGSFATLTLACAATGFAGVMAVQFRPHILSRFASWGNAWEFAYSSGYQQTRAMMCIASGGLLGLGAGNGWLKYVAASDTDLVFAFVSEEWGFIIALLLVLCIAVLALFAFRSCMIGRSSFYTIAACAAVTILVVQTMLNVFGTMDLLPLTGVTFPFVSNGGSSMLCSWGLIAFLKAADTRQDASFAVKTVKTEEAELDE